MVGLPHPWSGDSILVLKVKILKGPLFPDDPLYSSKVKGNLS